MYFPLLSCSKDFTNRLLTSLTIALLSTMNSWIRYCLLLCGGLVLLLMPSIEERSVSLPPLLLTLSLTYMENFLQWYVIHMTNRSTNSCKRQFIQVELYYILNAARWCVIFCLFLFSICKYTQAYIHTCVYVYVRVCMKCMRIVLLG